MPIIEDYEVSKSSLYLFNLPVDVTEKKLMEQIGVRKVKSVKLKYCMLGLPCAAHLEFYSENHITERFPDGNFKLDINGRPAIIASEATKHKLPIDRRQIVIKNLPEGVSHKELLILMS